MPVLKHTLLTLLTPIAMALPLTGDIIIAEIDAYNIGSVEDADGNQPDWIELYNTGAGSVSLNGWALSDDLTNPGKWVFPNVSIGAGESMVIFASAKDWRIPGIELHTNFSLDGDGEDVVLSQPNGSGGWILTHMLSGFPSQRPGLSYGMAGSLGTGSVGYFEDPSPGAVNAATVVTSFVADTDFDHTRGFYEAPFNLGITSLTPGATLIFTVDGSEPAPGNGIEVPAASGTVPPSVSIPISTTTIVRAIAVKAGMGSTNIDTHSFIFPSAVLAQDETYVTQYYAPWGHDKADSSSDLDPDWSMDPRVTGHANPEDQCVETDLQKIPTVSITMKWDELFGNNGIYIAGEGIDKRASFELINPDGNDTDPAASPAEHGRGEVRVFGGSSTSKRWKTDKLSLRFGFWKDFQSNVLGDDAIGSYERLVLDARLNQVWTQSDNAEQRWFADYARDAVLSDLENSIGAKGVHSQHVHLYLNGLYWGIYTLHERPDNAFAAAYLGGDKDDYDIVKHGPGGENWLVDGLRIDPTQPVSESNVSNTNYTAGVNYMAMVALSQADLSNQTNYDALAAVLDIPALIDHILLNFFGGNYDWPQHNWYASYNRVDPSGRWRFHSWDAEHVFKYVDYPRYDDETGKFEGEDKPDGINLQLLQNPEYRFLFADTAHKYLFNDGPFAAAHVWELFEKRFNDIDEAIRAESARWGDNGQANITPSSPYANELHLRYSNVPSTLSSAPGQTDTKDFASWWHERERIRTMILGNEPNRVTRFISQMRNATYNGDYSVSGANPLYPATDAPVFSQHGGNVATGYNLVISNPNGSGTLYYTIDGSDPREPFSDKGSFFSGDPAASALVYSGPIPITSMAQVKSRVLDGGVWSALNEASFTVDTVPASAANLVIAEIHYHPANPSSAEISAGFGNDADFEYFAVRNVSTGNVSLQDIIMAQGLDIAPVEGGVSILGPGEHALYVANPAAFAFRYGTGHPVAGQFVLSTGLSNAGERLHLVGADGETITDFSYDDIPPWPIEPDGFGPSLVLMQPGQREPQFGWNWRPSNSPDGSAGVEDFQTYADWQALHFSPQEPGYPAIADPAADPELDGLSNLEELFLGTDPRSPDPAVNRPVLTLETLDAGNGPETFAVFTFRYNLLAEEVAFTPLGSEDLLEWNTDDLVLLPPPLRHGDGTETRRYRSALPVSGELSHFYLLLIELR